MPIECQYIEFIFVDSVTFGLSHRRIVDFKTLNDR